MNHIRSFLRFLGFHRWRIALLVGLIFVFGFLLFPFSDLNDVIAVQVSKATQGQVFVQFEEIEFSLFPNTGLSLSKLSVETPDFGPISVEQLVFLPSIRGLIASEPSGILKMRGILKGDLDVSITPGRKTESGLPTMDVAIEGKGLALNELKKALALPVNLNGKVDLDVRGYVEPTFAEQPDIDLEAKVERFEMPPAHIDLPATGPISLPDTKISKVELKGRLSAGRFNIEKGNIGASADEFFGTIKGGVSATVQNRGGIAVFPGAYNLDLDLNFSTAYENKLKVLPILMFMESFKTPTPTGSRYALRVSGASFAGPPQMGPLR